MHKMLLAVHFMIFLWYWFYVKAGIYCPYVRRVRKKALYAMLFPYIRVVWTRAVRRHRRCRRPNVGVAPAPLSWRVHVMLYTSYMLLDFCNAVYNEAWTLKKSSNNDAGVFCNSPWYTEMKHGSVEAKVFSWTLLWKWYLMLKVSFGTFLEIWLIKRVVQWKISTACTVITAYKVAK